MSDLNLPLLTASSLVRIAEASPAGPGCAVCALLDCPGWESMPSGFNRSSLSRIGTLRDSSIEEPTYVEHHPRGTHAWSDDSPIAPLFYPYNRCDVWECVACARPFLRYTEYGGYYEDERIRALRADLVDDAPMAA